MPHSAELTRVEALFLECCALPEAQRSPFLKAACGGDTSLENIVAEILAAYEENDSLVSFFGKPETWFAPKHLTPGTRLGEYQIDRFIGQGGMGSVYLAHRADGLFERQVAIKRLAVPRLTPLLLEHLRREQTILSALNHPNIAKFFDLGTSDDGLPFFVMEYIEGLPLDLYCQAHQLSLHERLGLFRKICQAVHFAHSQLVVHLDLKPANILITAAGEPKLLDFGLARVLGDQLAHRGDSEQPLFLTPSFASPEQINRGQVSIASDIYALGNILFRLVTGTRPYQTDAHCFEELQHKINAVTVPKASFALAERLAKARNSSKNEARPELIQPKHLRGDLDHIIAKAMAFQPQERYATVQRLDDDLRHFSERKPIEARHWSTGESMGRFIQRHCLSVSTAFIFLCTFAVMLFHMSQQSKELEATLAAREKNQAISQDGVAFLSQVFQFAANAGPEEPTLSGRHLLTEGLTRIEESFRQHPRIQTSLMRVMARVSMNLGDYTTAECLLQQAMERYRDHAPLFEHELIQTHTQISLLFWDLGALDLAEYWAQAALAKYETQPQEHAADMVETQQILGLAFELKGRWNEAEALFNDALIFYESQTQSDPREHANALTNLALVSEKLGHMETAIGLIRQALALNQEALGPNHPTVPKTLNSLAFFYKKNGQLDLAESTYRQVLETHQKILPQDHPHMALPMNNLAAVLQEKGELAQAKTYYQRSLNIQRQAYAQDHPLLLRSLNNYASILYSEGQYRDAQQVFEEILHIQRNQVEPNPANLSQTLNNLGMSLKAQGQLAAAVLPIRESFEIKRFHLGDVHPALIPSHYNLGGLFESMGQLKAAQHQYQRARLIQEKHFPESHAMLGSILVAEGRLAMEFGEWIKSTGLIKRGLAIFQETLPKGHIKTHLAKLTLAECFLRKGQLQTAKPLLDQAFLPTIRRYQPEHRFSRQAVQLVKSYYQMAHFYAENYQVSAIKKPPELD